MENGGRGVYDETIPMFTSKYYRVEVYMLVSQKVSGKIYFSVFVVLATLLFVRTETCDLVEYMH